VSYQLSVEHFEVSRGDTVISRDELLPGWNAHDRLAVIVDRPFGGVGASLLIQLATTAYYDIKPQRRTTPIYPDVYIFHVGRYHGSHAWYDVFPPRKEVLVEDSAASILEALNERAITRLAVVDGPAESVRHRHKEPAEALDRIVSAWAYSPTGRVNAPDFSIRAAHKRGVANTTRVLDPGRSYDETLKVAEQNKSRMKELDLPDDSENEEFIDGPDRSSGLDEAGIEVLRNQRESISLEGLPTETYRHLSIASALNMLHSRN